LNILVTGGSGFIGSQICSQLLALGARVRVLDLVAPADPRVEFFEGDITSPALMAAAVSSVDAVCHQAAKVGLGVDFGDVDSYVSANDVGTSVLLSALWQSSFRGSLVLASSMVVYGAGWSRCPEHGLVNPGPRLAQDLEAGHFESRCPQCQRFVTRADVTEDAPLAPCNVYAATKLHQEQLCTVWGRESSARVIALRYHNVYGPGMPRDTPYAGVAAIFRSAVRAGRSPEVFEDGGQTRDFVHVSDVARANVLALTEEAPSGAYNVASGVPHTVAEMAIALGGTPVVTGRWRLGDVRHIVASPERARRTLGFEASVGFAEGMASL
jgi:dTDP-L-rhamnose 4-epimerase